MRVLYPFLAGPILVDAGKRGQALVSEDGNSTWHHASAAAGGHVHASLIRWMEGRATSLRCDVRMDGSLARIHQPEFTCPLHIDSLEPSSATTLHSRSAISVS